MENVREFIRIRDEYYGHRVSFQLTFMQNNIHELVERWRHFWA
ncbi:MAG: hypothetical protein ACUVRD_09245 [Bacteroidia bacterium]